jgi:hypothetical protein
LLGYSFSGYIADHQGDDAKADFEYSSSFELIIGRKKLAEDAELDEGSFP